MKTVWGSLLIGCILANSQLARAGKWTPYFGIGVSHSIMTIQYSYTHPAENNSAYLDKGIDKADLQVSVGVRGKRLGVVFRFHHNEFEDDWAERTTHDTQYTRVSEFSQWRDDRALFGIQYFLTADPDKPLRFFAEGGLGYGKAWYHEEFTYSGMAISHEEYDASTPTFFLQYANLGAVLSLAKRLDIEMNYLLQRALVTLDGRQWYGSINYQTENWVSAIQISAIIKITN